MHIRCEFLVLELDSIILSENCQVLLVTSLF